MDAKPLKPPSTVTFAPEDEIQPAPRPPKRPRPSSLSPDDDGVQSSAPSSSLVHDSAPGGAVTAFNLEDELHDGSIDAGGVFVPHALRAAAEASPAASEDSSGEEEEEARVKRSAGREDRDEWADRPESEDGGDVAPAYESSRNEGAESGTVKRVRVEENSREEKGLPDFVVEAVKVLRGGESVLKAIRRMKKEGDVGGLEDLTEVANGMMGHGVLGIYDMERGEVMALVKWRLSWGSAGGLGVMHGPFEAEKMVGWAKDGFFGHERKIGWMKAIGEEGEGEWVRAAELLLKRT